VVKRDIAHISLHLDSALAKAVRIQAINDGVSLKAWISQALIRRLAFEATALGDNNQRELVKSLEAELEEARAL
jgi:hypothetical protein